MDTAIIDRIREYIDNHEKLRGYNIMSKELLALAADLPTIDAILLAFTYGRTKGYQAAKVEAKHG